MTQCTPSSSCLGTSLCIRVTNLSQMLRHRDKVKFRYGYRHRVDFRLRHRDWSKQRHKPPSITCCASSVIQKCELEIVILATLHIRRITHVLSARHSERCFALKQGLTFRPHRHCIMNACWVNVYNRFHGIRKLNVSSSCLDRRPTNSSMSLIDLPIKLTGVLINGGPENQNR